MNCNNMYLDGEFDATSEKLIESMDEPLTVFRSNAGTWMIKPIPGQVIADVCDSGHDSADYANAVLLASSRTLLESLKLIANEGEKMLQHGCVVLLELQLVKLQMYLDIKRSKGFLRRW